MAILASGCPKPGAATEHMTQAPSFAEETGQSKCGVRKSSDKPLVVEWPAADRAALEARATRSLVAVRYEGCEMEVLTSCRALGEYRYLGLTQKREGVRIQNADELYAQLPVGAASLEGKLERAGQLNVDMVIVGRKEADKSEFTERDLEGRCEQATHVITGLTVGAFSFYAGASAELGGSVRVGNVGGGAGSSSEREVLRQDGDESACVAATTGDEVPPPGCGALLRVEVVPIEHTLASRPTSGTSQPADQPPPVPMDPELERKIRSYKILTGVGYGLTLGMVATLYGGVYLQKNAETKLESTKTESPVPSDREKQIARVKAGQGLLWGSVAGMAVFAGMALFANKRLATLRKQAVAATPTVLPAGAGLSLQGRF